MNFAPKSCACCGHVIRTLDEWQALPLKGVGNFDDGAVLEYRDCVRPCRNTFALETEPPFADRADAGTP